MRIALFSDAYHPRVSGLVSSIDEFSRSLVHRGHQVCIVCPSYPDREMEGVRPNFHTIRVPSGTAIIGTSDRLAKPWREHEAVRRLDRFAPDIVHMQTEFSIGMFGRRYARRRGLTVISTCHTMWEMYMKGYLPWLTEEGGRRVARLWLRTIYSRDDLIIAPTRQIRDVMIGYGIEREYTIIPTGVDERTFHPRPEQARRFRAEFVQKYPGFHPDAPLVLYAGRIGDEKNLDLLVRAFARVEGALPAARLLIVGEGNTRAQLHQEFRTLGLQDKVAWMDFQPREKLPVIYSAADVFAFPSMTETQGLVTVEAMLCGTPVVGVNRMGSAEILAGDTGGYLTENDASAFADRLLSLLRDPALRAAKAAEARAHAHQWSISHACDRLERLYRRVARRQPDPVLMRAPPSREPDPSHPGDQP